MSVQLFPDRWGSVCFLCCLHVLAIVACCLHWHLFALLLHVISFWLFPSLFFFLVPKPSWWPLGSKPGFLLNEFSKKWSMIAMITTRRPGLLQVLKFIFSGRCDGGSRDTAHSKLLMYWFSQLLSCSSLISWFAEVIWFFQNMFSIHLWSTPCETNCDPQSQPMINIHTISVAFYVYM